MLRVYFSFDYDRDIDRVNKIRQVPHVVVGAAAGFQNSQVWEQAARRGDAAVHGLIKDALNNTTVTVVCLGYLTAYRKYLNFELETSLERGNGIVGVKINHLNDKFGQADDEGANPQLIGIAGYKVYKYTNARDLDSWIKEAAEIAVKQKQLEYQREVQARDS